MGIVDKEYTFGVNKFKNWDIEPCIVLKFITRNINRTK